MLENPNELTEFLDKTNGKHLSHQQLHEYLLVGINSPVVGAFGDDFIESLRAKHKILSKEKTD